MLPEQMSKVSESSYFFHRMAVLRYSPCYRHQPLECTDTRVKLPVPHREALFQQRPRSLIIVQLPDRRTFPVCKSFFEVRNAGNSPALWIVTNPFAISLSIRIFCCRVNIPKFLEVYCRRSRHITI